MIRPAVATACVLQPRHQAADPSTATPAAVYQPQVVRQYVVVPTPVAAVYQPQVVRQYVVGPTPAHHPGQLSVQHLAAGWTTSLLKEKRPVFVGQTMVHQVMPVTGQLRHRRLLGLVLSSVSCGGIFGGRLLSAGQ
jgi:hypothetical protein